MTWAERVGDLATRLALVILTAIRIVTELLRLLFVSLDLLVVKLGEFTETGLRGTTTAERAWVRLPGSFLLGIAFLVLQLLAIFTVLFRQTSTTLNDFILGLAEGEALITGAPAAPPPLPPAAALPPLPPAEPGA
jgi:hypothetical protein